MKKVAIITLLVFTSLLFFACAPWMPYAAMAAIAGAEASVAESSVPAATEAPVAEPTAPPAMEVLPVEPTAPPAMEVLPVEPAAPAAPAAKAEPLAEEDFYLYEDGERIFKAEHDGLWFEFAAEQNGEYAGKVLETKRGMKIGSAAQEVAEAYGDIVPRYVGKMAQEGITYADFLANEEYNDGEENYDVTYQGETVDGKFNVVTKANDQHFKDIIAMGKPAMSYSINYQIRDGKVFDIQIGMADIMNLDDSLLNDETEPLSEEDFDLYEDGKRILGIEDYEVGWFEFASEQEGIYSDEYKGRTLETKRGIKIGSTPQEIAEAYGDIVPLIIDKSKKEGISYAEFLANEEEYDNGEENELGYLIIYAGEMIDGVFNELTEESDQHVKEMIDMGKQASGYYMAFLMKDGEVNDIFFSEMGEEYYEIFE